jgi:hypothetical protein
VATIILSALVHLAAPNAHDGASFLLRSISLVIGLVFCEMRNIEVGIANGAEE